jgi:mannitol/fructose-specific phosphotransferase system IIA component (Ntr-type)
MTLVTTLITPPLLNYELKKQKRAVRNPAKIPEKETLEFQLEDKELTDLMAHKVILQFQTMGFFVNQVDPEALHYNLRRHNVNVIFRHEPLNLTLQTDKDNIIFVRRMVHEAAFNLKQSVTGILNMDALHAPMEEFGDSIDKELEKLLSVSSIIPELKSGTKEGVVWELLDSLYKSGKVPQVKSIYYTVMAREKFLSGGLFNGLAIPHAHTNEVFEPVIAVGIKSAGIDFGSVDKKPSYIIFLVLTPEKEASTHIRLLASISRLGRQSLKITEILQLKEPEQIRTKILEAVNNWQGL